MSKGVGVIGCGVVGGAVVEILQAEHEALEKASAPFELLGVAVRHPEKKRNGVPPGLLTSVEALLKHPKLDILVEVAGGVEAPFQWVTQALKAQKTVVTANKAL